jgi:hypothetical protein
MDRQRWTLLPQLNKSEIIETRVPHGLRDVNFVLQGQPDPAVFKFRRDSHQPLHYGSSGTSFRIDEINDDIEGLEIVRYKSPVLIITAIGENEQHLKDFQVKAKYLNTPFDRQVVNVNRSEVNFSSLGNGTAQSQNMLPDEEIAFTVSADGYSPVEEKLIFKEGERRQLNITLRKEQP